MTGLVLPSPLAGAARFSLQIGIDHQYRGCIILHIAYNDRQGIQMRKFRSVFPAMPGDNLIAALWSGAGKGNGIIALSGYRKRTPHVQQSLMVKCPLGCFLVYSSLLVARSKNLSVLTGIFLHLRQSMRKSVKDVSFLTLSVSESAMYFIVGDTKITT